MKRPCVYILASERNGTLYIGVTSDLARRTWHHKTDAIEGFTRKYGVHILVHVEFHETMLDAITREKQLKKWRREKKVALVDRANPEWLDIPGDIS